MYCGRMDNVPLTVVSACVPIFDLYEDLAHCTVLLSIIMLLFKKFYAPHCARIVCELIALLSFVINANNIDLSCYVDNLT